MIIIAIAVCLLGIGVLIGGVYLERWIIDLQTEVRARDGGYYHPCSEAQSYVEKKVGSARTPADWDHLYVSLQGKDKVAEDYWKNKYNTLHDAFDDLLKDYSKLKADYEELEETERWLEQEYRWLNDAYCKAYKNKKEETHDE